jgi:tripartite-type tricarboxylate transporter receptor subunit TctC
LIDRRRALAGLLTGLGCISAVRGQTAKPVLLIVPFTPGGSTDILARALAPRIALALGQNVVVDNRPGAGGSIGAAAVAKADPDGNTLLMGHIGTLAVNVSLYPQLAYDPVRSFAPVALVAIVPNILVVNAASAITSLKDLVARAKAAPGKLSYSSGGNGSAAHIAFESLKLRAGLFIAHIPYRGTAPSVTDLLGGQVDTTFTGATAVLPHIRSGRLRALAVSSATRLVSLPDVPTVAESGYPGFEADQWYGIVAPAGTSPVLIARLNSIVNQALATTELAQQLAGEGAVPKPGPPQAFADLIAREIPRWREVVRAGKVKAE